MGKCRVQRGSHRRGSRREANIARRSSRIELNIQDNTKWLRDRLQITGNLATLFEMLVTLFEKLDNNQEC